MYTTTIYKNNKETIYQTLYHDNYNFLRNQVNNYCYILNSIQDGNSYFADDVPQIAASLLIHNQDTRYFINKWIKYPEYLSTVYHLLQQGTCIIDEVVYEPKKLTTMFKNDFLMVCTPELNKVILSKFYLLQWLINHIQYCMELQYTVNMTGFYTLDQARLFKEFTGQQLKCTN